MIAFRTPGSEMEERMDCNYYHPRYVENARKLEGHSCCRFSTTYKQTAIGHTASVEPHYSQDGIGVPFVSGKAIKGFELQTEESERITFESHNGPLADCKLHPGYLLVVRKGEVGNACVVPRNAGELSCASEVMFFEMQAVDEAYFLAAFLNAQHGRLAIERLQRGTIIFGVSLLDIPPLRVFWPASKARLYIGDKVRQAERLQAESKELEIAIHTALDPIVPAYSKIPQKCSRVSAGVLTDRFDTQPYRTHFLSLLDSVCSIGHDSVSSLASVAGGDPVPSELFGTDGVPLVRIRDITSADFSNPEVRVPETYALEQKDALATEGMIVVGMDGEFRAQFFLREELPQLVNQRVAILKTHGIRPELLTVWLNRNEGQYQLNRWTTQTTVGHIGLDDIRTVLVPGLDEQVETELADKALTARRCVWYAHALTASAKLLVEALIEGKVTEAELVAAQEALERGDDTADRALLRRLTRQGLDVPGQPPLFPDLDALYTLLAQTKEKAQ